MDCFSRVLLLSVILLSVVDGVQSGASCSAAPVEDILAVASATPKLALSHGQLWRRMWLSDFIDDQTHRDSLVGRLNEKDSVTGRKKVQGEARIELLQEAVLYGHTASMLELGQQYAMKAEKALGGTLCTEGSAEFLAIEALRWCVLVLEETWLATGGQFQPAVKILKGELAASGHPLDGTRKTLEALVTGSITDGAKKKAYEELLKSLKGAKANAFLSAYGVRDDKSYTRLAERAFKYCFLSKEEQQLRQLMFQAAAEHARSRTLDPWGTLAQSAFSKKDYETSAICFERSNTPDAWYNLGVLYGGGHIGTVDGVPNYAKAQAYYEQLKTPKAWYNLGILYKEGHIGAIDGIPNYAMAQACFEQSKILEAWFALGALYGGGHIGAVDGIPNYAMVQACYEQSKIPIAWSMIGVLYHEGLIGKRDDGTPDYSKAQEYYERSNTPDAWNSIGVLYKRGHIGRKPDGKPDYAKAQKCFEQSNTPEAWHNLGVLYFLGDIGKKPDDTPDYEQALLCLNQSLALGSGGVQYLINIIQIILKKQQRLAKLEQNNELATDVAIESNESDQATSSFSDDDDDQDDHEFLATKGDGSIVTEASSQEMTSTQTLQEDSLPPKEQSDQEGSLLHAHKPVPPTKRTMTKAKKIERAKNNLARAMEKSKKHALALSSSMLTELDNKQDSVKSLTVKFMSQNVEKQYNEWSMVSTDGKGATTLPELMKDIQNNPSGIHGMGKPEVLKGGFDGHKGCISEASGRKDRLVYKVTGPAEITIHSVGGHYE